MTRIVLPYPPSANRYWRSVRGRVLVSAEARAYKQRVAWLCLSQRVRPQSGALSVSVSVFRPRRIGDLDNTLKVLLDSLRGIAFEDDDQVVELHALRLDDKSNPRAEVTVGVWAP